MTPKFRIYDNREEKYCEEDAPLMLCMDGCIFDRANEDWYEVGERYVVELGIGQDPFGRELFEGDVVYGSYGYGFPSPESIKIREFMYAVTECTVDENFIIIGTIHDEKYKNL